MTKTTSNNKESKWLQTKAKHNKLMYLWYFVEDVKAPCFMHGHCLYAGTVMTSFDHVMIPTRGNWFQTNPLEHEADDLAGNRVSSVCITNGKDISPQRQIWSTFCHCIVVPLNRNSRQGRDIGFCESLVSYDFHFPKFTDSFGTVSSNTHLKPLPIFIPLE